MEKRVVLTWPEIIKWLTFIALLISSYVANQVDIAYLKRENADRKLENKELKQEQKTAGEQAAAMSAQLGRPKPFAVVIIHITEIHSLKPGPSAGKKIA